MTQVSSLAPAERESRAARWGVRDWIDRLPGMDPGLNRLRTALQAVVTIALAMLVERVFVGRTHALQINTHGAALPPDRAALVAAQHHGVLVIAIMVGAIIGMMSAFGGGMFATTGAQVRGLLMMPPAMIAGLTVGLAFAPNRTLSLVLLVVVLAGGAYCRRFGPVGFLGGMVVFMGDFFGFFLHGAVTLGDLGWLTAEVCLGTAVAIFAQYTIFYPGRRGALRRMRRSYDSRAREVIAAAIDVLDGAPTAARAARRLHRQLNRLNETALIIDAQLATAGAVPPQWSPTRLHQVLFDAELALTNTARFAEAIADLGVEGSVRRQARTALVALRERDLLRAELDAHTLLDTSPAAPPSWSPAPKDHAVGPLIAHRFAHSVLGVVAAAGRWRGDRLTPGDEHPAADDEFESSVLLAAGWLPGSALVSAAASLEPGSQSDRPRPWYRPRFWDRVSMAPNIRVAIQMGIAVGAAIGLGDMLSGRRFYWAVIAAFVTFMGANNATEQIRKGWLRVAGTFVGALVGAALAHAVGTNTDLAIAVILVSLFFGLYLMRISYAFMVVGITIMVAQLYVQLNEFSNQMLVLRLEETALGAATAAATILCVLPLRTGRVARVASRQFLEALGALIDRSVHCATHPDEPVNVAEAARTLDSAYQSLTTTVTSMRTPFSRAPTSPREQFLTSAGAARHYARNLVADRVDLSSCAPTTMRAVQAANGQLRSSLDALVDALQGGRRRPSATFVRAASMFARASADAGGDQAAPHQLFFRDLELIDGALATMATVLQTPVTALDTGDTGTAADPAHDREITASLGTAVQGSASTDTGMRRQS